MFWFYLYLYIYLYISLFVYIYLFIYSFIYLFIYKRGSIKLDALYFSAVTVKIYHRKGIFRQVSMFCYKKYMTLELTMPPLQTLSSEWWSGWFPTAQVCLLTFPHTNMPFPHCIHNRTDYAKLLLDLGAISYPWLYFDKPFQIFNSVNAALMFLFYERTIQKSLYCFLYNMK